MAEVKQYINLEPDSGDPRLGRVIHLKTKINVKKSRGVHLLLKPDPANASPEKLPGGDRGGISTPGGDHTAGTTNEDGSLAIDLVMSVHGGDKFSAQVSRDRAGGKTITNTDVYVVWRKLYYQLSRMLPAFAIAEGDVIGEYKKHFIELEKTSSESVPHKENLETRELPRYQRYFKGVKRPFEAHVVLIDRQCDWMRFPIRESVTKRTAVFPMPKGTSEWPFPDWLLEARWRTPGQPWNPGLPVHTSTLFGQPSVVVSLAGIGVTPGPRSPVDIDVKVKVMTGEYTGDATFPPHVFIALGMPRSEASKAKTVAHEIGHGIGMVPTARHSMQYDDRNGGMGSHCRTGATPNIPSAAKGGVFTGTYTGGTCVMYAFSSEHFSFCPVCIELVRGASLFKSNMKSRGW